MKEQFSHNPTKIESAPTPITIEYCEAMMENARIIGDFQEMTKWKEQRELLIDFYIRCRDERERERYKEMIRW